MPKHTDPREKYLALAARRFAERGFAGASLALVAKDAGVTRQALLHFFSTKKRLYAEVLGALSERLTTEIDMADGATPEQRLINHFNALALSAVSRPDDSRLVIRALLESDPDARVWPLKAYLDRLVGLTLQTRQWCGATPYEALAGLYQIIGAIQYFAISGPTFEGMRSGAARREIERSFLASIERSAREFAGIPEHGFQPDIASASSSNPST